MRTRCNLLPLNKNIQIQNFKTKYWIKSCDIRLRGLIWSYEGCCLKKAASLSCDMLYSCLCGTNMLLAFEWFNIDRSAMTTTCEKNDSKWFIVSSHRTNITSSSSVDIIFELSEFFTRVKFHNNFVKCTMQSK